MLKKINFKKIILPLKKIPRFFAERFFLALFILVLLALALGGMAFYEFFFKVTEEKIVVPKEEPLELKEDLSKELLGLLEERKERFEAASFKTYPNLFGPR